MTANTMTNWRALSYELKCMIFRYYIEHAVKESISAFKERYIGRDHHSVSQQHIDRLGTLLLLSPDCEPVIMELLTKRLKMLCQKWLELRGTSCGQSIVLPWIVHMDHPGDQPTYTVRELWPRIVLVEGWLS